MFSLIQVRKESIYPSQERKRRIPALHSPVREDCCTHLYSCIYDGWVQVSCILVVLSCSWHGRSMIESNIRLCADEEWGWVAIEVVFEHIALCRVDSKNTIGFCFDDQQCRSLGHRDPRIFILYSLRCVGREWERKDHEVYWSTVESIPLGRHHPSMTEARYHLSHYYGLINILWERISEELGAVGKE